MAQRSAWQSGGANMSISRAVAFYDVTENDIRNANPPIETRYRSCMGNGYHVVKIEDIIALERRVKEQKAIAKHGSREAWEQHQKVERDRKAKELQEKRTREEKERQEKAIQEQQLALKKKHDALQMSFVDKYLKILKLSIGKEQDIPDSIDGLRLPKTKAKKEWFLRDKDMEGVNGTKEGRTVQYEVRELIEAAEKRNDGYIPEDERSTPLLRKLGDRPVAQLGIYIRFLQDKLHHDLKLYYDDNFAKQVHDKAQQHLITKVEEGQKNIEEVETNLKVARMDHSNSVQLLEAFQRTFPPPTVAAGGVNHHHHPTVNASCDNENGPSETKKQKTSLD